METGESQKALSVLSNGDGTVTLEMPGLGVKVWIWRASDMAFRWKVFKSGGFTDPVAEGWATGEEDAFSRSESAVSKLVWDAVSECDSLAERAAANANEAKALADEATKISDKLRAEWGGAKMQMRLIAPAAADRMGA